MDGWIDGWWRGGNQLGHPPPGWKEVPRGSAEARFHIRAVLLCPPRVGREPTLSAHPDGHSSAHLGGQQSSGPAGQQEMEQLIDGKTPPWPRAVSVSLAIPRLATGNLKNSSLPPSDWECCDKWTAEKHIMSSEKGKGGGGTRGVGHLSFLLPSWRSRTPLKDDVADGHPWGRSGDRLDHSLSLGDSRLTAAATLSLEDEELSPFSLSWKPQGEELELLLWPLWELTVEALLPSPDQDFIYPGKKKHNKGNSIILKLDLISFLQIVFHSFSLACC